MQDKNIDDIQNEQESHDVEGVSNHSDEDAQAMVNDLKDKLLRSLAENENLRRRCDREKEESVKFAVTGFARDLLNVADNLRRALEMMPKEESADTLKNIMVGVEMTEKELLTVFERYGIKKISPMGDKFNHEYHQAIFEDDKTDQEAGTIVHVMQEGYILHDRLLRPAMVGVAKKSS